MVKTNLTVEDFEDKKFGEGKTAGRYTRFKTSEGWLSSFDKPAIEKLKDACGKGSVSVEVITDKNDKQKISKFYGDAEDNDDEVFNNANETLEAIKINNSTRKSVKGSAYEKDPVGLAVEIFVSLHKANAGNVDAEMLYSIKLVKQAQEAFQ